MNKLLNLPKIFVAMDFNDINLAKEFTKKIDPKLCGLKIGKELFTSTGPDLIKWFHEKGFKTFLDLKFHDIPTTVKKACISAAKLGVAIVNVHALGGEEMMRSAKEGLKEINSDTLLIGVTILTSHDENSLQAIGLSRGLKDSVKSLAQQAVNCGLDGVVCSAMDLEFVKPILPNNFIFITPGIRLHPTNDDQKRIMNPALAINAGPTILVIGRPITETKDPNEIINQIYSNLNAN